MDDTHVPPPPPDAPLEVVIRTHASDLTLLAKSGGSTAGFSGASVTVGQARGAASPASGEKKSQTFIWITVFAVGAVVLFFVGYYLIPLLSGGVKRSPSVPASGGKQMPEKQAGALPAQQKALPAEPAFFGHTSFFREAPEEIKEFDPYHTVLGPIDRASVVATIDLLTKDAGASGALFELVTKGSEGQPLTWGEFAGFMGASALDQDIIRDSFARDFTIFVWRDARGAWLGFIFKLKDGLAPFIVQKQIFSIETPVENFRNLFLIPPASSTRLPAGQAGAFADVQISGQPARSLAFQKPAVTFTYGWFFKNYFLMSTSEEGLKQALSRL